MLFFLLFSTDKHEAPLSDLVSPTNSRRGSHFSEQSSNWNSFTDRAKGHIFTKCGQISSFVNFMAHIKVDLHSINPQSVHNKLIRTRYVVEEAKLVDWFHS